jgi:epoxyqueuosine reductase
MLSSTNIKEKLLYLGYSGAGVIPAVDFDEYIPTLEKRIESFPHSAEMYKPLSGMAKVPTEAKSIIAATRKYTQYKIPESLSGRIGKMYLFDRRLEHSTERKAFAEFAKYLSDGGVKTIHSSVPARWAAVKAGLGFFGDNNFIYTPDGSYVLIDIWLVDAALEYDVPDIKTVSAKKLCGENCGKCIAACPTGALDGKHSMDMGKCVARFSFTESAILTEDIHTDMGQWLYGCDACQDACPMNKGKLKGSEDFPGLSEIENLLGLENIIEMNRETYLKTIQPWFFYIGEEGQWLWRRNALRAMINSGDEKYHGIIQKYADNPDTRLRDVAKWGIVKLGDIGALR